MAKRVAIIGAGPSGLAQIRAFSSAKMPDGGDFEVHCFEKQEDLGGLWNYTWRTGLDGVGEPVHSSMYRYLWSNGPKECLEFADYTFEEHFGRPIASYPPREVLWDYIKGRVENAGLRKHIRFCHPVRMVAFDHDADRFLVSAHDIKNDSFITEAFDYVVVASGHFSVPNVPYFKGLERFQGRIMHAHDFRDALEFQGQDILVVGSSYSAEDIASQCFKYGARSITISHRSRATGFAWPEGISEVPLLSHVDSDTAFFIDGTHKRFDAIILCTGYLHHFPFMSDELRLKTTNRLWPLGLYNGVVFENNPRLFYLGMQDQFYTFNMFDAQAWFARDVMMGRIMLPAHDEMRQSSLAWRAREETLKTPEDKIYFQGDYVSELILMTDYPRFDIEAVNATFMMWEKHKMEDIMGFRNNSYRSIMTGTMAPKHHTDWLSAMDDSLTDYLSEGRMKKFPGRDSIASSHL